jgi:hypothetical protein
MQPVTPELGEHVVFVGQNGSGKTTSAIVLLERCAYKAPVMVLDTKPESDLEQLPGVIVNTPAEALASPEWCVIYRPDREFNNPIELDAFLSALYDQMRPSQYVYIDETYHVVQGFKPGTGVADILMRGRKRVDPRTGTDIRLSVLASSQRPRWIPLAFWTESRHFYAHYLKSRDDRMAVSTYTGWPDLVVDKPVRGHEFYYYRENVDEYPPEKWEWRLLGTEVAA